MKGSLSNFKLEQKRATVGPGYYPAIVCRVCRESVITGNRLMDTVFKAIKKHECENTDASTS